MARAKPTLTAVLGHLLRSRSRKAKELSGGLWLAYTPAAAQPDGRYRLTLSRRGVWPSANEAEVVKRELKAALIGAGRHLRSISVTEKLSAGGWRYHLVEWTEYRQIELTL